MLTILNLPQQLTGDSVSVWVIFPVWSCRLLRDYSNMTVCTTPLEVSVSHTHTHMTPPAAVCCGSWSAASVNWLSVEEKEEEKEEGAAGHEQQRRWRPIGNQCTVSISAPHGQNNTLRQLPQPSLASPVSCWEATSTLSAGKLCSLLIDFIN